MGTKTKDTLTDVMRTGPPQERLDALLAHCRAQSKKLTERSLAQSIGGRPTLALLDNTSAATYQRIANLIEFGSTES